MATEFVTDIQSTTEVRIHYVDFTSDLPTGVTVSSGTAVHTPPSGAATTPTVGVVMTGDILPVTVGPLTVTGRHIVTLTATLSDGEKSVARLIIPVEWESARSGMYQLINVLRGMTAAGSDDYTVGGMPFWTDKQIQDVADRYRTDFFRALMAPVQSYSGGTVVYKDYFAGAENIEQTTGGTAIFTMETADGSIIPSANYTMDYNRGAAVFAADTGGSSIYWSGRSYDLNRAAADIWRQKASHYSTQFSFSTDNHKVDRGVVYQNCLKMADFYEQKSSTNQVVTLTRSDVEC